MRSYPAAVLALLFICACACAEESAKPLFPITDNGKCGLMDRTGQIVIPPIYTHCQGFAQGLAAVEIGGKWGFIDETGTIVIQPQFDLAGSFGDGLCPVKIGEMWGYIDTTGKIAIPPQYTRADSFYDGMAHVELDPSPQGLPLHPGAGGGNQGDQRRYAIINTRGEVIGGEREQRLAQVGPGCVQHGEGLVATKQDDKWGYMNADGVFVIEPRFVNAGTFSKGMAQVVDDEGAAFIDKTGKALFRVPEGMHLSPYDYRYAEGMIPIAAPDLAPDRGKGKPNSATYGKWGYMDYTGKIVIEPQYREAGWFSEGLACVHIGGEYQETTAPEGDQSLVYTGDIGYIDKTGKLVIKLDRDFDDAGCFSEGLAAVRLRMEVGESKWGFIDKTGKAVIEPQYTRIQAFRDGLATVWMDDDTWGYVDKTGKTVWREQKGTGHGVQGSG